MNVTTHPNTRARTTTRPLPHKLRAHFLLLCRCGRGTTAWSSGGWRPCPSRSAFTLRLKRGNRR